MQTLKPMTLHQSMLGGHDEDHDDKDSSDPEAEAPAIVEPAVGWYHLRHQQTNWLGRA